jgi:hypothetical protein
MLRRAAWKICALTYQQPDGIGYARPDYFRL